MIEIASSSLTFYSIVMLVGALSAMAFVLGLRG